MNRQDFQLIAEERISDAQALLATGTNSSGAYYLAGYAVECALKACIAKQTKQYDYPDKKTVENSYTHNIELLLKTAKIEEVLESTEKKIPRLVRIGTL